MSFEEGLGFGKRKLIAEIIKQSWGLEKAEEKKNYTYNDLLYIIQELLTYEGKQYLEGKQSIMYGHNVFRSFVELLLYRNLANYDSMILITAEKGVGKSSAAIMLARYWCKLIGIKFDPARHIAYNNADVMRKIDLLNHFEPIIADESIRFASSEDWAKCLVGDTVIKTLEGNCKIKDLVGRKNFKVYTFNEITKKAEIQIAEKCIATKMDVVYELETRCGKKIRCTKEHRFLTQNGWRELQQLKVKDEVVSIKQLLKIKSIKKVGREQVYDIINVNNNQNFIANNFVVHNSQNKELKKKLAQVRTKHLLYILCFPLKIYKVEKTYLENFVNYWCVKSDTKILIKDSTGMIRNYPIKDLRFKKDYQVASFNTQTKEIEYKTPEKCIKTKNKAEVYEMELVNGQKIKCTKEHPFLTDRGYVRLEDLEVNDVIVTQNKNMSNIRKIVKLKKKVPVYDIIGVDGNHNYIANNMIVHNCDLYGRGIGAIYVKDKNPVMDSWRMKEFTNIGSYTEFTNQAKVLQQLKKHPNFWMQIRFPKPPAWLYEKYLKVREKNVYDEDTVLANVSKEDVHRALLIMSLRDILLHDTTLTMNRILLHIRNEYDVHMTRQQVELAIEDAKQLVIKVREKAIET